MQNTNYIVGDIKPSSKHLDKDHPLKNYLLSNNGRKPYIYNSTLILYYGTGNKCYLTRYSHTPQQQPSLIPLSRVGYMKQTMQ
jgi:hypothetical protein